MTSFANQRKSTVPRIGPRGTPKFTADGDEVIHIAFFGHFTNTSPSRLFEYMMTIPGQTVARSLSNLRAEV